MIRNQTAWGIVGCGLVVALGATLAFSASRHRQTPTRAGAGARMTASSASRGTAAAAPNAVSLPAAAVPAPALNVAAYDAQLDAIANVPPPQLVKHVHWIHQGKHRIKQITTSLRYPRSSFGVPLRQLWPAKAPLPEAGALLPFDRIIAYYGNLYSRHMGVLGEYPPQQMLRMLTQTTAAWQAADPTTRAVPALDYIAVAAQGTAGRDGEYRMRMSGKQIDKILAMAAQIHALVFLDVQVGRSNVEAEIPQLAPYLKLPQVELAIDPEFAMHGDRTPGTVIGTLDAADINWAARYLAQIADENHLPPKILVVHRFTQPMVTHYQQIRPLPQVQIVMDMDGFGYPSQKIKTYKDFIQSEPVQFTGFKLFYKNDIRRPGSYLLTPEQILKLCPRPSYIQYQ